MLASLTCFTCNVNHEFDLIGPPVDGLSVDDFNQYAAKLTCKCENCFNNRLKEINEVLDAKEAAKKQLLKPKVLVKRGG